MKYGSAIKIFCLLVGLTSCASGSRPFYMAQLCLQNAEDLTAFTNELRLIAHDERINFVDGSADTKIDLDARDPQGNVHSLDGPVINIGLEGRDGVGMTAANLGLPPYQVVLGFSEGSNGREAWRLVRIVTSRLSRRWPVEAISAETGAQPMRRCN